MDVALFIPCYIDQLYPHVAIKEHLKYRNRKRRVRDNIYEEIVSVKIGWEGLRKEGSGKQGVPVFLSDVPYRRALPGAGWSAPSYQVWLGNRQSSAFIR